MALTQKLKRKLLKKLIKIHFPASLILRDSTRQTNLDPRLARSRPVDWKIATEVTRPSRIRWAINQFQPYKSPGTDGIYYIYYYIIYYYHTITEGNRGINTSHM